jgi:hypothetical protein
VKANVILFDNREASVKPWTKEVWYYDYRTNVHHTLKKKTMRFDDLADFRSPVGICETSRRGFAFWCRAPIRR